MSVDKPNSVVAQPSLRGKCALLLAALDSVERRSVSWRVEFSDTVAVVLAAMANRSPRAWPLGGDPAAAPEPRGRRRKWFLKIGSAFLAGGVLLLLLLPWWAPRILSAIYPDILFLLDGPGKTVALTIDDVPSVSTSDILAVLRRHDVRATFFVVTDQIGDGRTLAQTVEDGHEIAHHMKTTKPCIDMALGEFRRDFDEASERLSNCGNVSFFRPASGFIKDDQLEHAKASGYRVVLGTASPLDNLLTSKTAISRLAEWLTVPGGIIILHDGPERGAMAARVLDDLIPRLKKAGYRFEILSED